MNGTVKAAKAGERFLALDSIRGVLAATVVIFHVRAEGWLWQFNFFSKGYLAVTFFFVLSGFVIGISYGDRLAQGFPVSRFLGLRLGRIYPLHLFMIGLLLFWETLRLALDFGSVRHGSPFTGLFDPSYLPHNFALVQKFAGRLSWNDPSWSIGVEWWTYIMFALLAAILAFRRGPLATATIMIMPWFTGQALGMHHGPGVDETVDCMMNFGLGLLVCEMRRFKTFWQHMERLSWVAATCLELATVTFALWMISMFGGRLSPLISPTFAFVIGVFSLERGAISRLLVTGPMLLLGELSFSIYMIHHFILDRMLDLVWAFERTLKLPIRITEGFMAVEGNALACDLFSVSVLLVTIPFAVCSYRYIEKPARLWSRRMINPNHSDKVTPRDPTAAF